MAVSPILAAVIGNPVRHSLSPMIHTIWAHRARVNGYYIPVEAPVTYDGFVAIADSLRKIGFAGANVTIPHKEHALRYADTASDSAMLAGAANMLTFSAAGVIADNSDIAGFREAFLAAAKPPANGGRALVLGAGGAARGVIIALKEIGFSKILIANRTQEKAELLADKFNADVIDWMQRDKAVASANAIVNTTSLGMTGNRALELDLAASSDETAVCDIVYSPLETPLLKQARKRNLKTVDGLSMLMHQAVPGFTSWFSGNGVVDHELRSTLIEELERRAAK